MERKMARNILPIVLISAAGTDVPGVVDEVADRDSHEHGADVGREIEAAELVSPVVT